jgi:hypothetical protein
MGDTRINPGNQSIGPIDGGSFLLLSPNPLAFLFFSYIINTCAFAGALVRKNEKGDHNGEKIKGKK